MSGTLSGIYNFHTKQYDYIAAGAMLTMTDEQIKAYMPQDVSVQGIFDCHRQLGETTINAYLKTMEAVAASYQKGSGEIGS